MHSGLEKILQKIAEDPSNRVLTDRYVALVSELESDSDKIHYILKLSGALTEPDPRAAMEFAFSVFQYDQHNLAALETISGCLKILGRFGKSEVIKNEIAKIRKLQQQNKIDYDLAEKFVTEVSAIRVEFLGEDEPDIPIDALPDDAFVPNLPPDPKATVPINRFEPKPMPRSAFADPNRPQQDLVKLELQLPDQNVVAPRQPSSSEGQVASGPSAPQDPVPAGTVIHSQHDSQPLWKPLEDAPEYLPSPEQAAPPRVAIQSDPPASARELSGEKPKAASVVAPSRTSAPHEEPALYEQRTESTVVRSRGAPRQTNVPPASIQGTETMPSSWSGPDLKVLLEQFEFYFKHDMLAEAETLLRETEACARDMTWWKARRAIMDEIPPDKRVSKAQRETEDEAFVPNSEAMTQNSNETGRPQNLKQWMEEIEALIAEGKSRKALSQIRKDLPDQTEASWGLGAMELLEKIWADLGLQGFSWQPADGMSTLVKQLKKRQPIRLAKLAGKRRNQNSA